MNGLGINKAPKNDKDADILTPDEVALLRTHASDGTLTAEERELYSKHLEAMRKLIPEGKKKGKPYGLGVWAWFVNLLSYVLVYHQLPPY